MEVTPQIYTAKVMHKRLFPAVNAFTYSVYYVALPLPATPLPSPILGFQEKDHGNRDGSDVTAWIKDVLKKNELGTLVEDIVLITMPRVLGYVFNPVSFFMCLDKDGQFRAVLCEVHNTFGEQHCYLCARADRAPLAPDDWLEAEKVFHVSPFLPRNGHYKFRFALVEQKLGIWIDYFDAENNKQLLTALTGQLTPLNSKSLAHAFWTHPLLTLKVVALIHWQALKLVQKGIRYIVKPLQLFDKISNTRGLTKQEKAR